MSRGYRIQVPLSVAQAKAVGADQLSLQVALMPILTPPRMAELLRAQLVEAGWKPTADGGLQGEIEVGVVATLNKDGTSITVSTTTEQNITATGNNANAANNAARAQAKERTKDLNQAATAKLASREGDVRAVVDAAIQKVYATALEEKARSLGQLESMERQEGADGTVEIVLKVRV